MLITNLQPGWSDEKEKAGCVSTGVMLAFEETPKTPLQEFKMRTFSSRKDQKKKASFFNEFCFLNYKTKLGGEDKTFSSLKWHI